MTAFSGLIQVIQKKYFFLKLLNKKNDLLKYFIVDEKGFFTTPSVAEIEDEFIGRFRRKMPKINDIVKNGVKMSFQEYQNGLFTSCFKNYISALEQAIDFSEKMN